jgi:hypothetical protein
VPTSIGEKLDYVSTAVTGLLGYAYSIKTGSYKDPFNF